MENEEYYVTLTIPVDEIIHTDEHPFCSDPTCPCKSDQEAIQVVAQQVTDGLLTPCEADRLYRGQTL
jgi:hypothetical protein